MKSKFIDLIKNKQLFGYFLIAISLGSEALALFIQYGLGYQPCSLCVLMRSAVALMGIAGLVQIVLPDGKIDWFKKPLVFLSSVASIYWMLGFTYEGLMIEKGKMIATCSTSSPFPSFLPLDSIFPFIFQPHGICGVSPTLFADITLMELSLFGFIVVALLMALHFTFNLIKK